MLRLSRRIRDTTRPIITVGMMCRQYVPDTDKTRRVQKLKKMRHDLFAMRKRLVQESIKVDIKLSKTERRLLKLKKKLKAVWEKPKPQ